MNGITKGGFTDLLESNAASEEKTAAIIEELSAQAAAMPDVIEDV